jgi:putative heme-binding domain-containing protein
MTKAPLPITLGLAIAFAFAVGGLTHAQQKAKNKAKANPAIPENARDARNTPTGKSQQPRDPEFAHYGIYEQSAPRPSVIMPIATSLPLDLKPGDHIAFIGNTLFERSHLYGHVEALLHQRFPKQHLVIRNLSWSADEIGLAPRPANFADIEQHLTHEKTDVILAAYGFNESFAGDVGIEAFRGKLTEFLASLKSKSYNGRFAPRVVLISPIANENITGVPAADMNNARIERYAAVMREVAAKQEVGFVDVFKATHEALRSPGSELTVNGCHLTEEGYAVFAAALYKGLFGEDAPEINEQLRQTVIDKDRQFFRRYRPLNTFYYTGGRNEAYGYLDFLPAMRNFDLMVANRDQRIWDLAQGKPVPPSIDDSNIPPLPKTDQTRGANEWLPTAGEQAAFQVDPRFEVNLFAGEDRFPEIANPIQIRFDTRGRMWVSCSNTYPHVYPGNEPRDKIVILEDTDGDGRADKSTIFADNLQLPLSFELGDGGVYVSEQPSLTFLKDTDGDDRADVKRVLLSGFGTEDSHHALHDFIWTPDGDLLFRESIFHHSQVETPYGPVRQQNSGWFRYEPRTYRLTSFGTYPSTNPWGVAFDDWGNHVASHPVFAEAFHALDPPYPEQHPSPAGLRAYSGTCGHEFVDCVTFPAEMQGNFIKVRYKPTNRVEIHKWVEGEFGYDEEYVSDVIFSTNLSFIPVDLKFGPRGDLYICDWYNPIKGHMQYSLRDERRDRHSGRIWRVTAKGQPLTEPPPIAGAPIPAVLDVLKRPESRLRYLAKRELRDSNPADVRRALDNWVQNLTKEDPRLPHHQLEAIWTYRTIGATNAELLRDLLASTDHRARAAGVQQLRFWHRLLPDHIDVLRKAANDKNGLVRMQAAIAASYIGSKDALDAMLDVLKHPRGGHLAYAITCALESAPLRRHWEGNPAYNVARILRSANRATAIREPTPNATDALFDGQKDIKVVNISCQPERMLFTLKQFAVTTGQPVKIVFTNPDATDHNLVVVKPDALADVGIAANEMAKDSKNANSDFVPATKRDLILHASPMIGPTRKSLVHVLRFRAPTESGIYPYVCTFPGHWVVMNGEMIVAKDLADVEAMLAARQPTIVKEWILADFPDIKTTKEDAALARGMTAFVKARCNQCHVVAGHGVNLGPDLVESVKKLRGRELLQQILDPSSQINDKYQTTQFVLTDGRAISGVVIKDEPSEFHVMTNLLAPEAISRIPKSDIDQRVASKISPMPAGLANVLTKAEILDLLSYLEAGGYQLPAHLEHQHHHKPN